MIRRYGEPVKTGQIYKRRPGVYAILARGDRILATHQEMPEPEYQLPGGGIDKGEQPIAALHREVREETGWKIAIGHQLGVFRRFTYMPDYGFWAEKICTVYLARPIYRLGPPTEPGHLAVWLTIAEAMDQLGNVGDRSMLSRYSRTLL
jgi:8-oxo-dGTP diphosphatase